MLEKLLISACLVGNKVRYDGGCLSLEDPLKTWLNKHFEPIIFCPEVAAGLPTPRNAAEIIGGAGSHVFQHTARVKEHNGTDVTDYFLSGAHKALKLCQENNIRYALLAEFSPSCGSTFIYDGTFSGTKIAGRGVTAELLEQHGIRVYSPQTIHQLMQNEQQ